MSCFNFDITVFGSHCVIWLVDIHEQLLVLVIALYYVSIIFA